MADEQQSERTLPATARRREEARERGEVAKSRELISAMMILGAALLIYWMGERSSFRLGRMASFSWSNVSISPLTQKGLYDLMLGALSETLWILVPVLGYFGAIAILSSIGHYGFVWTGRGLTPDWGRINPITGFSRMFSWVALFEFAKTLLKFLVIGFVIYKIIENEIEKMVLTIQLAPDVMLIELARMLTHLLFFSGVIVAVIGVADYLFQWWDHEKRLRMTPQEMKEELKHTEGDPLIRSRIRSIQREMARKRMMAEVPKAAVVITNPTELAIALCYEPDEMGAPRVVAKGAGFVAQTIREIARANGVPLVENKPVARALYKMVSVGEEIPGQLYRAVAEILVYVYRLRGGNLAAAVR